MKPSEDQVDLDEIDLHILTLLQEHCKQPLAKIGEQVGLSPPAVIERIKKLEDNGIITAYTAILDARKLGRDITAFIGVTIAHPKAIDTFEREIEGVPDVLECHHVTGGYTLLVKVKTYNTRTLEELISRIRSLDGVGGTETMVVLSTHTERLQVSLQPPEQPTDQPASGGRRLRRSGDKQII